MKDYENLVKTLRNRRICIQQLGTLNDYPLLGEAADAINNLMNERKTGKWIEYGEPNLKGENETWYWACSECKQVGMPQFNYCPYCGARMTK